VGTELDALTGLDLWKIDNTSPDYNYELIRDQLQTLARLHEETSAFEPLLRLLRVGLHHDLGNMGNPRLYGQAHVGTKKLIEDYVDAGVCLP
jgi:TAG lipase/steryl ester hydrolase/phospholipase A2/LPA acyltransferase